MIHPEIIDQALHMLWGAGIVWIAMAYGMRSAFAAFMLPVIALLPREFVDQWDGWHIGNGKMLDIICYGLGGLSYYIIRMRGDNSYDPKGLDRLYRREE
jgi:hypothetical protein